MEDTLVWEGGGHGTVVTVDKLLVTVRSTRAFPPGQPAQGVLHAPEGGTQAFTLKIGNSRRVADRFEVRGRLLNATTNLRTAFTLAAKQP